MIIPLQSIVLTEDQLNVARDIALSEINDVTANLEIFSDSIRRTYFFKDFDMMQYFYRYLKEHNIPISGVGLDDQRLQELFFHYHEKSLEDRL